MNFSCSQEYSIVALWVLIAMFASYAALDLAARVTAAGGWTRAVWLLGGPVRWGLAFGPCTTLGCWRAGCQFPWPTIGRPFCCHSSLPFSLPSLRCTRSADR